MPPRQSDMTPCRSSSASAQASESHARGPRLDPWGDSSISNPATNKNDDEDHILVDRRDRPRPIGDERQRPTFKKS
ncbi:hypothetical protein [Sporisorium scitamineum]|nr:hypothetical protein [Sporisorium scitamineum]